MSAIDVILEVGLKHPPRIGRRRNLGAGLERRDQHVDGGTSEKIANSVRKKYSIQRQVRSRLMLPYLTVRVGAAYRSPRCWSSGFIPGLLMSRRMKIAATASIGNMEQRDAGAERNIAAFDATLKPRSLKNVGVVERPPAVRYAHDIEIRECDDEREKGVIAMMLRIIGNVTYQMRCHHWRVDGRGLNKAARAPISVPPDT